MVKDFVRCGLCDIDFKSTEEWERHANTDLHKDRIKRYYELVANKQAFMNADKLTKKIRDEITGAFKFR
jgi:uncharacterized C2H2 Zn-finger protein